MVKAATLEKGSSSSVRPHSSSAEAKGGLATNPTQTKTSIHAEPSGDQQFTSAKSANNEESGMAPEAFSISVANVWWVCKNGTFLTCTAAPERVEK